MSVKPAYRKAGVKYVDFLLDLTPSDKPIQNLNPV